MVGNSKAPFPHRLVATVSGAQPTSALRPKVIIPFDMPREVYATQLQRGLARDKLFGFVGSQAPAKRDECTVNVDSSGLVNA